MVYSSIRRGSSAIKGTSAQLCHGSCAVRRARSYRSTGINGSGRSRRNCLKRDAMTWGSRVPDCPARLALCLFWVLGSHQIVMPPIYSRLHFSNNIG